MHLARLLLLSLSPSRVEVSAHRSRIISALPRSFLHRFASLSSSRRLTIPSPYRLRPQLALQRSKSWPSPLTTMATATVTTPDRDVLPATVVPINYDISLYDLKLNAFTFNGTVSILANVVKSTKDITLNALVLKIHSAEVLIEQAKTQSSIKAHDISYDELRQRATLSFPEEIPATDKVTIVVKFSGEMANNMAGFYRSKYKPTVTPAASVPKDDEFHYMFSTQFEACDARRAFPCFDEPNLKATFDVSLELPEDQVALSNMPVKSTQKTREGLQVVSFERTPIMSTYLLAWAIGDFEYIEDYTKRTYNGKPLPCRVYTTRGLKEQGRFALEHAPQIIDYFSEVFDIDYPLPKADLLAVHEFSHGAMENWGLVTYRTTAVLYDEKVSDPKFQNRVAYVVAHELAHQWFGNLVTMDWWSELWLNEGFATWVGWLATDKIHPDWNVWDQFVQEGMQTAYQLDALRSSHPIEVPVKDALEVDQIFDAISYLKGSSAIRMLATHLGHETFLKGVAKYLKAHAYGNATTSDLWEALSEVSGQDVPILIDSWIRKIGFPVLTVAEEPGQISIKQSRFLSTGDAKAEDDTTTWWTPLGFQGKIDTKGVASIALTTKEDTIRGIDDSFYKLNTDNAGFYRVNYPPARLAKLGTQFDRLTVSDKIGLVADAGALSVSGAASTSGLLSLVKGFESEDNYLVWSQVLTSLSTIKSVFSADTEITNGLKKFIVTLIGPAVEKIGWEKKANEDYLAGQLRALLIITAGFNGHTGVIDEAKRRFQLYLSGKDKSVVSQNLRSAIFQVAIREGSTADYEALKNEWREDTSIDGKETTLRALGRFQAPELLSDYLNFLFTEVAVQDVHTGAIVLAAGYRTRPGLWKYIKDNFNDIKAKIGGNSVVIDRFLKVSLNKFADLETERDIASFFEGKDNRGYDRTLSNVSESITTRAGYRARDDKVILEWLKVNGFA
ncbi:peptidase family M1 [Phlyctema vagabunda]|uniref:Aminopeptidase n=1 Tax=Phlyctema vagabunda TaxID=108571 RepID=A0ABR4PWB9_9HELO